MAGNPHGRRVNWPHSHLNFIVIIISFIGIFDGLYNEKTTNESEENIKIKAFERIDEPTEEEHLP